MYPNRTHIDTMVPITPRGNRHPCFSSDGKHVAHFAFPLQPTGNAEHGLFLDGKYTPINYGMNTKFLTFSPDCKHLAWFQAVPSTLQFRIVIDGKPVAQTESLSTLAFLIHQN